MRADDRALVDAAAQVADGAPVDWVSAESHADAASRRLVRHLRLVESIASLHRSISPNEGDDVLLQAPAGADRAADAGAAGPHWGRLSILDRIGHGTSCDVYRAWDTALHREVALKLLHDDGDRVEAHTRLLEEARRLARVRHTHVVQVYGAEQHDGRVGLWMELVRGESLEQTVQSRGPFGAREAALIGLDLCAAIASVHGAGLLHRDIKAQNVMRESGGRLVLMDFGTGEELSGTNRLIGTPLYLAPEIFRGQRASIQSDLYSLGVLLYYLVTGKFPVNAGSMEQLARAHTQRQRQPLRDLRPDLPEAFISSVERALDSDPTRRYQSIGQFESALRESLDVASAAVPVPAAVTRPRFGLSFVAAAVILAMAVVGLIVWTRTAAPPNGTAASAVRTIAILPMSDQGGGTFPPHLAAGLSDELLTTLGQVHALNVKSALSVKALGNAPPREIADKLGVDAWLETTLSSGASPAGNAEDQVRVRASLIAAGTQNVIWTRAYERPRGEILALQTDIARDLVRAVGLTATPAESERLQSARQTNPAAEEAYLLGRLHLDQYGGGSAAQALRAFERAFQLDPRLAGAHGGAARAHVSLGLNGAISNPQARASALAEIRRALEVDQDLAEPHATLAHLNFIYDWDWQNAEREFRRSLELNPNSPYARTFYAEFLAALGRFDEALIQTSMAKRLDPESGAAARRHALVLYYSRDFSGAAQALREAMIIEPNAASGDVLEGRILEATGRFSEALSATERASELSGGGGVPLRVQIIRQRALSGQREAAIADYAVLRREAEALTVRLTARDEAYVQLALGDKAAAFDALSRAVADHDPTVVWVGADPRLDALKADPRFRKIVDRIGLPQ